MSFRRAVFAISLIFEKNAGKGHNTFIHMEKDSKIYVAGHSGLVGSAIMRSLSGQGFVNVETRARKELDLMNREAVAAFFTAEKPEYVFMAAAKVGGILANNTYSADFIYENLAIQNNIIFEAYRSGVKKMVFLGSSCVYPRMCPQPIKEEYLLTGELEETNKPYAVAKIAGIVTCQSFNKQYGTDFISVMPTNTYGPNDHFDLANSHVLPALIRKFHEAAATDTKEVVIWGTGSPRREFVYVDDLADACVFVMNTNTEYSLINIGTGEDVSILELVEMLRRKSNFRGEVVWDKTKPDGTPRKLLDVSRLHSLGWRHKVDLEAGIEQALKWYGEHVDEVDK